MHLRDGAIVLGILFVLAGLVWLWDWLRRAFQRDCYIWRCHRSQGGGVVDTPHPMIKGEALQWCGENLGFIMYVDETNHFIFYRAKN